MRLVVIILLTVALISGCRKYSKSKLLGNWQAVSLTENNKAVEMSLDGVSMHFNSDGGYLYNGTLTHKEAGFFDLSGNLLLTLDTLNQGSSEKAVELIELNADTLKIKMKEGVNERILAFKRIFRGD